MKTRLLAVVLALAAPLAANDHARGLLLLKEGKFAEAAAAFRAAAERDPADPRVHYNLALALWRAGDAAEAEIAAEKAATLSDGKLVPLRDGIFGNLRMSEAQGKLAAEQPDLQAALGAAQKARDHFLHGAAEAGAPAELTRNLERALQLIAEIEKKIEEQEKEEKKDDESKDGDQKSDDQKPDDKEPPKDDQKKDESKDGKDPKSDDQKKDDEKKDDKEQPKSDEQKEQDQKQQGKPEDKPPEPKPEKNPEQKPDEKDPKSDEGAPEAKPGEDKEQKPEPKPGQEEEQPPPGEGKEAQAGPPPETRELSPEETKRLLDVLEQLRVQQTELEKARAAARPKVKKDW